MEATHPITIKVSENVYIAAQGRAEGLGYVSVEEYLADWIESDVTDLPMTTAVSAALDEGIADICEGRTASIEEVKRHVEERRAAWIEAHRQ